jgi:hypothetical protein
MARLSGIEMRGQIRNKFQDFMIREMKSGANIEFLTRNTKKKGLKCA